MYPKPFKRKDRGDQYFFKYTDQWGNRRQKNTGETSHRKAQRFIRDFIDRISSSSGASYRNYANQFLSAETSPRAIRLAAENRPIGEMHLTFLTPLSKKFWELFCSGKSGKRYQQIQQIG